MKKLILTFILMITFSIQSFASCLPVIEAQTKAKEEKLIQSKIKEKKVAIATGATFGGINAVFWGVMFKLIADGATIPISILVGTGYGVVTGGAAVAVVGVPMVAYNQVIKAQIRKLKNVNELISAANSYDQTNRLLKKMFRKVKRKVPDLTMTEMIAEINFANDKMVFCPENGKIYGFNKIKKYLRNNPVDNEIESIIFETTDGEITEI